MSERNPILPPWRDISELKADDGLVFATVVGEPMNLRIMLWDAAILMENISREPLPYHLQFPATHWFYMDELELPEV